MIHKNKCTAVNHYMLNCKRRKKDKNKYILSKIDNQENFGNRMEVNRIKLQKRETRPLRVKCGSKIADEIRRQKQKLKHLQDLNILQIKA